LLHLHRSDDRHDACDDGKNGGDQFKNNCCADLFRPSDASGKNIKIPFLFTHISILECLCAIFNKASETAEVAEVCRFIKITNGIWDMQ
jgi:hypothetical protein